MRRCAGFIRQGGFLLLVSAGYLAPANHPLAAEASHPAEKGTIQRKVLIFDFENRTGKPEFDYLAGSIADALVDPIKKTKKFQLLSRDEAKMDAAATPADADSRITGDKPPGKDKKDTTERKTTKTLTKFNRDEAIRAGREAGADVVVFGKYSELNGVLLMSAQAYETDTRALKVAEEILTKEDSDMFNGINQLADKMSESMARELPMLDALEAELRLAEARKKLAEARNWEIQLYAGFPYMHGMYGTDGTVNYNQGFPVHKLKGYSFGAAVWQMSLPRLIFFMPKDARFGFAAKATLASGFADIVGANSTVLATNQKLTSEFYSGLLLLGIPYLQFNRFMMFAEIGGGAMYGQVTTATDTVFRSTSPGAALGTSAAYHWSYWSIGFSYRAQAWFLSSTTAFLQHDAYIYAGLRL